MWTRAELKSRAKAGLRQYYWYGFLVVFVAGILGAGSGGGSVSGSISAVNTEWSYFRLEDMDITLLIIILAITLAIFLAAILFGIFVSNVVMVGKCRYFSISALEQRDAGFSELFGCFRKGRYLNTVKVQFLRGLYETLWSCLFIIPGIIKHYEYYMVPYLVAEYPSMDSREIFARSREMMAGNKFRTWVLELSFIGWYLLGMLACCIGGIFVNPYYEAVMAELYLQLREERLGIGRNGAHAPDQDGAVYTQQPQNPNWQ